MSDPFERAARLKKARLDRGFKTAGLAAEYLKMAYGTYSGHENGSRGIKESELIYYAKVFRVSPSWLAFGEERITNSVKVVGTVLGQDPVRLGLIKKAKSQEIKLPFSVPVGVEALHISTNDFAPYLHENDYILLGSKANANSLINQRVAIFCNNFIHVGLLLSAAKNKHYHLQLFNGRVTLDLEPNWIAPIIGILYQSNKNKLD